VNITTHTGATERDKIYLVKQTLDIFYKVVNYNILLLYEFYNINGMDNTLFDESSPYGNKKYINIHLAVLICL